MIGYAFEKSSYKKQTAFLFRLCLWSLIWLHIMGGVMTLLFVFPFQKENLKRWHIQRWSKGLLGIFKVELVVHGSQILPKRSYLLAANHISWLDIHVINAFNPIRFVAKSEVEGWPIFGWMAKQLGTVFIKRDNLRHAREVSGEVGKILQSESICIFPEGTSSLGTHVLPFRANLFESAVSSGTPVYPLVIQYFSTKTGLRSDVPAFVGEMGLLESISNILKERDLRVELSFLEPLKCQDGLAPDRKRLAQYSQEMISSSIKCYM